MYKYLFGPVPSRRLGISLGVDLVPKKVCSLDCVYCEVGRTSKLTIERKEYIPCNKVKAELKHYLKNNPKPDYITLTGSGEPTLNSEINEIIRFIKQNYLNLLVAVLTNGTLLDDQKVREDIMNADVVLPSLNAASGKTFQKINRPFSQIDIEKHVLGLIKFRKQFKGKIWLEVFILPGFNDHGEELLKLKRVIEKIKPDSVQLNTLDRPGAIEGLYPATKEELERIAKYWAFKNLEIVVNSPKENYTQSNRKDVESAILTTISRRPCTVDDMEKVLSLHENGIQKYLDILEEEGKIESVLLKRGRFYQLRRK